MTFPTAPSGETRGVQAFTTTLHSASRSFI
ncbi:hypothetical protein E2C01_055228 [Portunus trituberculatus]|uniref:Uncharacterized protein n=1 Tax=Portunus trituberculatus TaxID=210409 RepID=A0A5B7GX33_PORTR|nr:hypothetical protein [Portunus trituberculatus]